LTNRAGMCKAASVGLFGILLLATVQPRAFAQGQTWLGQILEQTVNSAGGKAGALRYNAALQIDSAGYDSDIYFGWFYNRISDYMLSVGPDLRVFLPLKSHVVIDIADSPRYIFFAKTAKERALNNIFAGNLHLVFDKFYVQAGGGLDNAKQRLSPELNFNVRLKTDDYSGLILWQASKDASFAVQCQRTKYAYENLSSVATDISANLDRTESFARFLVYLRQRSRVRFYLDAEYGVYRFTNIASSYRDSRSYGAYAGVEFVPPEGGYETETSGMRGSLSVGYKRLNIINTTLKDYSGLAGNVAASLGIIRRTALRVFFLRGPEFSAYSSAIYYVQTSYGAGLSRSLSRHVVFIYDFSYSRGNYPAAEAASTLNFRYWTHALHLSFRLRRDLLLSLLSDLGKRKQLSAPQPVSNRSFIGISLTYGHPGGWFTLPTGPLI
jgi:hypothetical protein